MQYFALIVAFSGNVCRLKKLIKEDSAVRITCVHHTPNIGLI